MRKTLILWSSSYCLNLIDFLIYQLYNMTITYMKTTKVHLSLYLLKPCLQTLIKIHNLENLFFQLEQIKCKSCELQGYSNLDMMFVWHEIPIKIMSKKKKITVYYMKNFIFLLIKKQVLLLVYVYPRLLNEVYSTIRHHTSDKNNKKKVKKRLDAFNWYSRKNKLYLTECLKMINS